MFGSTLTYSAFDDAVPFLRWAKRRGVVTGVVSNADERYGDAILPMLGLDEHIDFFCFSKVCLLACLLACLPTLSSHTRCALVLCART
jgi:FMN phosphatase YigB (HAD superfamily)